MISKSISTSRKLAIATPFTALLFTWLVPHCDDGGNMNRDAHTVKMKVVPGRPETIPEVEASLKEMEKLALIDTYEVEGEQYLHIIHWGDHQTLRLDRATWEFPAYPKAEQPSGNHSESTRQPRGAGLATEGKISKGKVSKEITLLGFDTFWSAYPRKTSKKTAMRSWARINPNEQLRAKIMAAVAEHSKSEQWQKDEGRFIPHPATWLNQERWEDELKPGKPKVGGGKFESVKSTRT